MADAKIGRAVLEIVIDDKQYKVALDGIDKKSDETAKHVKGIEQALNLGVLEEFGRRGLEAVSKVAEGIVDLGERGAAVDDVTNAFGALTAKTGETADAMLGALRQGVVGSINDFDLMTLANKTLGSGLVKSSEDMGTLSAGARALAKATGGDTKAAFDTLTSAMASGRTATLKQIGVFVDAKVATENFAAAHGKSVSSLTDAERAQALSAASLAALRDRLRDIPPDAADFGEKIQQVKVQLENMRDELAVNISKSPVLAAAMDAAGKAIGEAFSGNKKQAVDLITQGIEGLAIWGVKAAKVVVDGAALMSDAFYGTRFVLNAVLETVSQGVALVSGQFAKLFEFMSSTPGLGETYAKIAASLRTVEEGAKSAAVGFGQLKEQTATDSNAAATAIGLTSAALDKVVTAMETAKGKAAEAGKAGRDMGTGAAEGTLALSEAAAKQALMLGGISGALTSVNATAADAFAQTGAAMLELIEKTTLARQTGIQQQMTALDFQQQHELAKAAETTAAVPGLYQLMAAQIGGYYQVLSDNAIESYVKQMEAAGNCALSQQEQAQLSLDQAREKYKALEQTGKATYEQLQRAYTAVKAAEDKVDEESTKTKLQHMNELASGASGILRSLFGKSKAAAIAAAIVDTAAAVVSSYKNAGGYPWGIAPAAAMLAAGIAQINKIRSTDAGFAEGTPGLDFANFGTVFPTNLHGSEAVIPRGKGHLLAGEIASEMGGDGGQSAILREVSGKLDELPRKIARAWATAAQLA